MMVIFQERLFLRIALNTIAKATRREVPVYKNIKNGIGSPTRLRERLEPALQQNNPPGKSRIQELFLPFFSRRDLRKKNGETINNIPTIHAGGNRARKAKLSPIPMYAIRVAKKDARNTVPQK
jgi:hypothetical protein